MNWKKANLNKSYHQNFLIKDENREGKNKEQINSPLYLYPILLFPNYLHVQNPIFHSTLYFSDNHFTLTSAPLTTDQVGHFPLYTVGKKISHMFMGFLCPQCPQCHKLLFSERHVTVYESDSVSCSLQSKSLPR